MEHAADQAGKHSQSQHDIAHGRGAGDPCRHREHVLREHRHGQYGAGRRDHRMPGMPQAKPVGKPGQSRSYLAHASSTSLRLATPSLSATRCTYVNTLPVPPLLRRMRRHTSAPVIFFPKRHIQHQRIRPGMRVMAVLDRHCGRTRAPHDMEVLGYGRDHRAHRIQGERIIVQYGRYGSTAPQPRSCHHVPCRSSWPRSQPDETCYHAIT